MEPALEQIISRLKQIRTDLHDLMMEGDVRRYQVYTVEHEEEQKELLSAATKGDRTKVVSAALDLIKEPDEQDVLFQLFLYSYLLHLEENPEYAVKICELAETERFSAEQRLFLFHQLKHFFWHHPEAGNTPLLHKLYLSVLHEWKHKMADILTPIRSENRNRGLIVVITLQFLNRGHAPTKTALERIYTIGALLHNDVICINSREQYTLKGFLPIFDPIGRMIEKDYDGVHTTSHNDFSFALIQPETEMPDEEMVRVLLEEIRNLAPWKVVVCGDRCLLGDLCAEMIPTIDIPMVFSTIPKVERGYSAVGRTLSASEKSDLAAKGYNPDSIIESVFTFELIPQTSILTKEQLQLPNDRFLLGIIGIRLDADVSKDFLETVLTCVNDGIHLVFAGKFDGYERLCNEVEGLSEHSTFVGFQKDILALWDLLDLYINPPRLGGGFSVAEAFSKGKPGICLQRGDVAASAGPDFCVDSLQEYPALIRKYITDHDFYNEMSRKALKRSERLFDSGGEMEKILLEMEKRDLWF
ncbi:MAG: hypothetical protein J5518_12270 [Lachnospiraceae bacterium]|nr:hypothetical protein [Lachnospiraceae bacterium]